MSVFHRNRSRTYKLVMGVAIMPKGVARAAFADKELIDARDLKASYCAVSQAERLKKND